MGHSALRCSAPKTRNASQEITSRLEALTGDDYDTRSLARIIAQDPGMTANVMQLVNSAYFGLATNVSTVEQAVKYALEQPQAEFRNN